MLANKVCVDVRPLRYLKLLDGTSFCVNKAGVTEIGIYGGESSCSWIAIWVDDDLKYRVNMEAVAWFSYMPSKEKGT